MELEKEIPERQVCKAEAEAKCEHELGIGGVRRFADVANQFDCDIAVHYGGTVADGKSFLPTYLLAATHGSKIRIRADGPDAQEAIDALRELVEEKRPDEVRLEGHE
ncbi:MAG: HPr family phosphocarrier protein [Planctomycetota bacterium]|jgi:phosphotransferase system HPr (HPr) family protein